MQYKKAAYYICVAVLNLSVLIPIFMLVLTVVVIPLVLFAVSGFGSSTEDSIVPKIQGIAANELNLAEPMVMEDITYNNNLKDGLKLNITFQMIRVTGVNNVTLKTVNELNKKDRKYEVNLHVPDVYLTSQYLLEGEVGHLKFNVGGLMKVHFKNVTEIVLLTSNSMPNLYLEFLLGAEPVVNLSFVDSSVHEDDPFRGTAELSGILNKIVEINWNGMAQKIKPFLEKLLAVEYMKYFNTGYAYNPYQLSPNVNAACTILLMSLRLLMFVCFMDVLLKAPLFKTVFSRPLFLPGKGLVFD